MIYNVAAVRKSILFPSIERLRVGFQLTFLSKNTKMTEWMDACSRQKKPVKKVHVLNIRYGDLLK